METIFNKMDKRKLAKQQAAVAGPSSGQQQPKVTVEVRKKDPVQSESQSNIAIFTCLDNTFKQISRRSIVRKVVYKNTVATIRQCGIKFADQSEVYGLKPSAPQASTERVQERRELSRQMGRYEEGQGTRHSSSILRPAAYLQ